MPYVNSVEKHVLAFPASLKGNTFRRIEGRVHLRTLAVAYKISYRKGTSVHEKVAIINM